MSTRLVNLAIFHKPPPGGSEARKISFNTKGNPAGAIAKAVPSDFVIDMLLFSRPLDPIPNRGLDLNHYAANPPETNGILDEDEIKADVTEAMASPASLEEAQKYVFFCVDVYLQPNKQQQQQQQQLASIAESRVDRRLVAKAGRKRDTPSTGGQLGYLIEHQRASQLDTLYNNRPPTLRPPPVTVYFQGFRSFQKTMGTSADKIDFTVHQLSSAADFVNASLQIYKDESDRQAALDQLLLLQKPNRLGGFWMKLPLNSMILDGGFFMQLQGVRFPISVEELKNGMGSNNTDPVHQAMSAFVSAWSNEQLAFVLEHSCCPGLTIGARGEEIIVHGAVFADRFYFERLAVIPLGPLPPTHGCARRSPYDRGVREVAKLFLALDECLDAIQEHFEQVGATIASNPPAPPPPTHKRGQRRSQASSRNSSQGSSTPMNDRVNRVRLPDLTTLYIDEVQYSVEYLDRLAPGSHSKTVFTARVWPTNDGPDQAPTRVVKFAYTYSADVHRSLGSLAPTLHHCGFIEELQMYVAIMDLIDGHDLDEAQALTHKQVGKLEEAKTVLQGAGYVLGDVREPNILVAGEDELWLIDFDWAGKQGEVCYPEDINMSLKCWAPGVGPGGQILLAHDEYLVNAIIQMYGPK